MKNATLMILPKRYVYRIVILILLSAGLLLPAARSFAQGGCSSLAISLENYEPCCYRVQLTNTNECFPFLRLLLDSGSFTSWGANMQNGWTGEQISPTEILLTHSSGIIPLGASTPIGFCIPAGVTPLLSIQYDYTCPPGEGCIFESPLDGCPVIADASIVGVKYRECANEFYSNQPTLPGWTITLLDAGGIVLDSTITDDSGAYAFYDLAPGNYIVRETAQPGWTSNIPASGQYAVSLLQSEVKTRNFGNCPVCSCDLIYFGVQQIPVQSDVCCYNLSLVNNGVTCFSFINVSLASGMFAGSTVTSPGWTVVPLDPQHIRLFPPGGGYVPTGSVFPLQFCVSGSAVHNITIGTSFGSTGAVTECNRPFTFTCPPPPVECCPAGTVQGPQLATNGDFEAGNTGFFSGYPFFTPGGPTAIGKYSVLMSNQVFAANSQWACTDHTASATTGKMLIVDGSFVSSTIAWRNTVNVQNGVQYAFCAYTNNLVIPTKDYDDPTVQLWINNAQVASVTLPETPDAWVKLSANWVATLTGAVNIEVRVGTGTIVGNDFAVDDISFRSCLPAPCQASFTITPLDNCGHVQVINTSTGPAPIGYQWCSGESSPNLDLFLPCGPHTFCVTATCADGSTSSATQTITVTDLVPPVAVCNPGVGVELDANCSFTLTPAFVDGGSTDNCQIQSLTVSPAVLNGCGDFAVTLTVTDWCGNTSTCTMGIQTGETVAPSITCPPNTTVDCDASLDPANTGQPVVFDACGIASITNSAHISILSPCQSILSRLWTVTDNCGNTATCVQQIEIIDLSPPTIMCPPNLSVGTNPGQCFYTGTLPDPTATDNCDPNLEFTCSLLTPTMSILITPQTQFPKGVNNITCFAKDDCGNQSANCNYILTVVDNQPPVLICPQSVSVQGSLNPLGQCKAVVNNIAPTATDNCPMLNVTYSITGATTGSGVNDVSGTMFMQGISTVTYTAMDMGGNVKTCSFTVSVSCNVCPDNFVQNGNFSIGTPSGFDESIALAANWSGPWIPGINGSTGDFYHTPTSGIIDPLPYSQGNYGNFWCYWNPAAFWREGIMNQLAAPVPPNTGLYDFSMKIACAYKTGTAGLSVFGVPTGAVSTGSPTGYTPNNPGLFTLPAVLIGNYPIPGTCNQNYTTINFTLNSNSLPVGGIDRIFLTRLDGAVGQAFVAVDDICLHPAAEVDSCCVDSLAFVNLANQGFTVIQNTGCTVTVCAPQFNNCHYLGMPPDFGDGTPVPTVTVPANGCWTHTYTQSGVYNICATVYEDTCWSRQMCTTVNVNCQSCACGTFSNMFLRWATGAPSQPMICGGPPVAVGCPKPGSGYSFTGAFHCQGVCPSAPPISWTLTGPSGTYSGPTVANPYFGIQLPPAYCAIPGLYTLTLQGYCGGQPCPPCVIRFIVDCPDPCPCDVPAFQAEVNQGFATILSTLSCKVCFSPLALKECDEVEWLVNGISVGTSAGAQTFCRSFPGSGTYTVTMVVTRRKADGTPCETFTYTRTVTVTCLNWADCSSSVFDNPRFNEGAIAGGLLSGGASTGWYAPCGEPVVVSEAPGSLDGWSILLTGNLDSADVLSTIEPVCLAKDTGMLSFRMFPEHWGDPHENLNGKHVRISLYTGDDFEMDECDGIHCFALASIALVPFDSGWVEVQLPYDLNAWNTADSCGDAPHGVLVRPAIFVTNGLGSNQGGSETRSSIQIDNFCMGGQLVSLINPGSRLPIRIFPNPNPGTFNVELPEPAKTDMRLRISDLAGRRVLEQRAEPGKTRHSIQAGHLPDGLYFLQVVSEGRVIAVEKFVKQR